MAEGKDRKAQREALFEEFRNQIRQIYERSAEMGIEPEHVTEYLRTVFEKLDKMSLDELLASLPLVTERKM